MELSVILHTFRLKRKNIIALAAIILTAFFSILAVNAYFKHRNISALSWALAGKLIIVDPGHGGEDPGALGSTGVHEKDIVLEVSKKLVKYLGQAGAQALLTRDSDRDLSDPGELSSNDAKLQDLTRRVDLANKKNADLFISIHVNSFPDRRENGAQTFSQPGSEESKKLADAIQAELNRFLENPGREAKQVDYFTNRMTKMPSVIVEIGFISNPQEEKSLLSSAYQNKIAWAVSSGIARYLAQSRVEKVPLKQR